MNGERECVNIEGTPVQFLPAYDDLLQEALAFARVLTMREYLQK